MPWSMSAVEVSALLNFPMRSNSARRSTELRIILLGAYLIVPLGFEQD